jgi:hypothetical protein
MLFMTDNLKRICLSGSRVAAVEFVRFHEWKFKSIQSIRKDELPYNGDFGFRDRRLLILSTAKPFPYSQNVFWQNKTSCLDLFLQ